MGREGHREFLAAREDGQSGSAANRAVRDLSALSDVPSENQVQEINDVNFQDLVRQGGGAKALRRAYKSSRQSSRSIVGKSHNHYFIADSLGLATR